MREANFILIGVGLILLGIGGVIVHSKIRGIRNNNPGNLRLTSIKWNGKVPNDKNTDGLYEQFITPIDGIRAMFIDVRGDIEKDGLNTIAKLITEYAPPNENDTTAYINSVAKKLNLNPTSKITSNHYFNLIKAIITHENGINPYSDSTILTAMGAA